MGVFPCCESQFRRADYDFPSRPIKRSRYCPEISVRVFFSNCWILLAWRRVLKWPCLTTDPTALAGETVGGVVPRGNPPAAVRESTSRYRRYRVVGAQTPPMEKSLVAAAAAAVTPCPDQPPRWKRRLPCAARPALLGGNCVRPRAALPRPPPPRPCICIR